MRAVINVVQEVVNASLISCSHSKIVSFSVINLFSSRRDIHTYFRLLYGVSLLF